MLETEKNNLKIFFSRKNRVVQHMPSNGQPKNGGKCYWMKKKTSNTFPGPLNCLLLICNFYVTPLTLESVYLSSN